MAVNNLPSSSLGGMSPNDIVFGFSRPPHAVVVLDRDTERVYSFIEDLNYTNVLRKLQ